MTAAVVTPPPNPPPLDYAPPPPDYAPPPPWHRRRGRRVGVGLITIALVVASCRYGPPVYRQARTLYWQRQCLTFTLPPDRVTYAEDPADMAALLATGGPGYQTRSMGGPTPEQAAPAACYVPACYDGFTDGTVGIKAIVFLHERTSKAGRRLVVLSMAPGRTAVRGFHPADNLMVETLTPGTWNSKPVGVVYSHVTGDHTTDPPGPPDVCIYAGQADPADASHLTVRYRAWGTMHVIDGSLNAAGNDVDWTERATPGGRAADRG